MKVGIVSCYFKENYGSVLQAYATQKFLDNNGIPNETIEIEKNKDFKNGKKKFYFSQIINFSFLKTKFGMIKFILDKKINKNLKENIIIRSNEFKSFKNKFNLSKSCSTYNELKELSKNNYSDILLGSDQLWLPVNVVADYYTLNWVPDNINKISYATSFGISEIPNKYQNLYNIFLKRINHLSVREENGVNLIKKIINKKAELVCDPVFLLTKENLNEIVPKEKIIKDKYILCYFLGNNIDHRKFAEKIKKVTGYKIVSINHCDEYVKYSDKFADIVPYDIGPDKWLNLIKNAEYVCTDSFHCTAFSIIYNKQFFDFKRYSSKNKNSTNSRIDSLLKLLEINKNRILTGNENALDVLNFNIDYEEVNKKLSEVSKASGEWLLNSIEWVKEEAKPYIKIINKELCTGCTACKNVCPKDAIKMIRDDEGFLYPKVNEQKCVKCGLCKKTCPVLNKFFRNEFKQEGYIFQHSNKEIRKESTSGGAFTAIAEYVLQNKGIVYGVGFDKEFNVKHLRVSKSEDLYKFRNSKYVQSDPNITFKEVLADLKNNLLVCYSGTACQIEGLKAFLKKEYDNLITVDVICRAVPSPLLWKKYFDYHKKNININKVFFREKFYGYKYSNLSIYDENNCIYHNGIETDPYLRAFFSNIACRPSCYNCHFKEQLHKADFTLWDCFEVYEFAKDFDDDLGTTRILINSQKAKLVFDNIRNIHKYKAVPVAELTNNFYQMFNSIKYNPKREKFFEDLLNKNFDDVINEYFPNTFKCKLEKYCRKLLIFTKLYKPIIKIGKIIRKRN